MDQERDTTDNARSSRRGRFWLENGRSGPEADPAPRRVRPSASQASKGIQEITPQEARPFESADESLPVLFELPDRTPEALQRKRESAQITIHNSHKGPPASHVDPPSGNQSRRGSSPSDTPPDTDSAEPERSFDPAIFFDEEVPNDAEPPAVAARIATYDAAAQSDKPMTWAQDTKALWVTRSAIVMSVLVMVTLAFFSGRGLHQLSGTGDETGLSDVEGEDLGETIVIITEDNFPEDSFPEDSVPKDTGTDDPSTVSIAQDEVTSEEADSEAPSYVADAPPPAKAGALGEPTASASADSELAKEVLPNPTLANESTEIPPAIEPNDAVVAYRANENTVTETVSDEDNLPEGMESRLRLEDGLRYSDTPHAIGNFLEILKAWEASESK